MSQVWKIFLAGAVAALWPGLSRLQAQAPAGGLTPQSTLYEQSSEVNNLMVPFRADMGSLRRFYFVNGSPERRERIRTVVLQYRAQLLQLPFTQLNKGAQVDYILFRRDLDEQLYQLEQEAAAYRQLQPLFPFADSIYITEQRRRRGAVPDAARLAALLHTMTAQLQQSRDRLQQDTSLSEAVLRQGAVTARGLQQALTSVFNFYNGYDPLFSWWVPAPYRQLDSLLKIYEEAFALRAASKSPVKDDGSGIKGQPAGREALLRQLAFNMIPYTPEELTNIALREFEWCDAEMRKASADMGFGNNWKDALEKVKNTCVPPAEQPAAMMQLYEASVSFIEKNALITLPPLAKETWRMNMMSPERQRVSPFFLGGEEFIVSYPTNTMSHAEKMMNMRGNNPHFSRATVHHELLAGHALQAFMGNRYKSYRHFDTPFWTEGWALYWERLLWDLHFPESAEDRVGMLFWRMHRCARIIFSLNYHLGKWSPQQCIDFLVERVGHERANAEGEVRRSFTGDYYGPLYQLAYMIGGLQFEALKKELVDSGKMTYLQFHDAIIKENEMPVEMVRALLTNRPLQAEYKSSWRFYNR